MDIFMQKLQINLKKNKPQKNPSWTENKHYSKMKVVRFFLITFLIVVLNLTIFALFSVYQSTSTAIEQAQGTIFMRSEIGHEVVDFKKYDAVKKNLDDKNSTTTLTNIKNPIKVNLV